MARSNAYIESYNWEDRGCSVASSCLNCPLERCRYDEDQPHPNVTRALERVETVRALELQQVHPREMAERLGICLRSTYRLLKKTRSPDRDRGHEMTVTCGRRDCDWQRSLGIDGHGPVTVLAAHYIEAHGGILEAQQ